MSTGTELRRDLELAHAELSQRGDDLLKRLREAHIGDDWMYESGLGGER